MPSLGVLVVTLFMVKEVALSGGVFISHYLEIKTRKDTNRSEC